MSDLYHPVELPRSPRRGRFLVTLALVVAVIAGLVAADAKWEWRDYMRRLMEGEDLPAFREAEWKDARTVRETLQSRLALIDPARDMEETSTRRDLALLSIINAAGDAAISRSSADVHKLMEALSSDTDWLEEIAYALPPQKSAAALNLLAAIYRNERSDMESFPECRRYASALAYAAARAGLSATDALARYRVFVAGSQRYRLNADFAGRSMWEMSIIATQGLDPRWGELETLTWFQNNVRLPAQEYPCIADSLPGNTRSLFGVLVGSEEFYTLYRDAVEKGMATVITASGCSTPEGRAGYAATAACANGVPAVIAGNGEQATCLVKVGSTWVGGEVPPDAHCSWAAWGYDSPDFLRLVATVGSGTRHNATLAGCRLVEMARFLVSQGNIPRAQEVLRDAIEAQPLHYAAWSEYLASGVPDSERARALNTFADYPGVQATLAAPTEQKPAE